MELNKLTILCKRLLEFELPHFLLGVSSGQFTPHNDSIQWEKLKSKAQNNQLSTPEIKELAIACKYEKVTLIFELLDELREKKREDFSSLFKDKS